MPSLQTEVKSSWADEVEEGDYSEGLPQPVTTFDKDIRTITEYKRNEDGKKVKVIRQYKVETKKVLKSVARRRALAKFGDAKKDGPGPDPATTNVAEEISMQFVSGMDTDDQAQDDTIATKLKQCGLVKCRYCKGDHWSSTCPYKDKLGDPVLAAAKVKDEKPAIGADKSSTAKYVPPARKEGAAKTGESMSFRGKDDRDFPTIRITNLSESTRETDLQELCKQFGSIQRVYLGKDKASGASKGFAFVSFHRKEDALKAIKCLSGYGYDHLILNVEWSKPSGGGT